MQCPDGKYFGSIRATINVYDQVLEFQKRNHGRTFREVMDADIDISDVIQKPHGQYLQRSSPKCNGYLEIVVPERKAKLPVQAINGRCLKCGYRLAWVVVLGKRLTRQSA